MFEMIVSQIAMLPLSSDIIREMHFVTQFLPRPKNFSVAWELKSCTCAQA